MEENKKPGNVFTRTIYRATHYRSYHSYMKALHRLHYYAIMIFVAAIGTLLTSGNLSSTLVNMTLVLMMLYFFCYYWVNAKGGRMKKDSRAIMREVSLNGYISRAWNVYDGIYRSNPSDMSLELSFSKENSLIVNLYKLFVSKVAPTLPMDVDDIVSLRHYIHDLEQLRETNDVVVEVYATLNEEIAKKLREKGFILRELPHKYVTKPFISDMAVAYKNKKMLMEFRSQNYQAYLISINSETYDKQLKEELKLSQKQHKEKKIENN